MVEGPRQILQRHRKFWIKTLETIHPKQINQKLNPK